MDLDVECRKFPPSVFVVKVYGSCRKSLRDLKKAPVIKWLCMITNWCGSPCVWVHLSFKYVSH